MKINASHIVAIEVATLIILVLIIGIVFAFSPQIATTNMSNTEGAQTTITVIKTVIT